MDDSGKDNIKELYFKTVENVLNSDLKDIGAQCETIIELDMNNNK